MNDINIQDILNWSKPKRVNTRNGIRYLAKAAPTDAFWSMWNNRTTQGQLRAAGISLGKAYQDENTWEVCWWQTPTADEMKKLQDNIAASQLAASDAVIPKPENLAFDYFPFQKAGIAYARGKNHILIGDDMGLGKCHTENTLVTKHDGSQVPIKDLKVGDHVFGSNGTTTKVLEVHRQPPQQIYRVKFWDGSSLECDGSHLWKVTDYNSKRRIKHHGTEWMTVSTERLIEMKILTGKGSPRFHTPMLTGPIRFEHKDGLAIDPYTLGILISQGTMGPKAKHVFVSINEHDTDVVERMMTGTNKLYKHPGCFRVAMNGMKYFVRQIGVEHNSPDKRIPNDYMIGSYYQRLELLRGLMDGDGSIKLNRCTYHTVSPILAQQVKCLVASLGGIAKVRPYDRTDEGKRVEFQVNVKMNDNPFWCRRKSGQWTPTDKAHEPKRTIVGIEKLDKIERTACIKVSNSDHLFACGEDYVLSHNTIQAIGIINDRPDIKTGLVICPAAVKRNWYREFQVWLCRKLDVAVAHAKSWPGMAEIVILNYDILGKHEDILLSKTWDIVVADESHMLRNTGSKRWKAFKEIKCRMKVALTGTPLLNKLEDVFPILHWMDPEQFRTLPSFRYKFVNDPEGRNRLQVRLRESFMVRRLKSEVLKELPSKLRQVIEVDDTVGAVDAEDAALSGAEMNEDLVASLMAAVEVARISDNEEDYNAALSALKDAQRIPFDSMARVRHETALRKVPLTIEHLNSCFEQGINKILVFGHHRDCIEAISAQFPKSVIYYGGMSESAKDASIQRFMSDPECNLWIGSIRAAGMGINGLQTVCQHAVFHEMDWVPAMVTQAEDRLHRMNQKGTVLIQHLVISGSLDANMAIKCVDKQRMADEALDKDREKLLTEVIVPIRSDKSRTSNVVLTAKEMEVESIDPSVKAAAMIGLQNLAGMCDGARTWDSAGFNKVDAYIGKRLASMGSLTDKQGLLAKKLCNKYRRQLSPDLLLNMGIKVS